MAGTAKPPRGSDETNFPTEQPASQTHSRLSRPYGNSRRSRRPEAPTRQGAQAPHGLDSAEATKPAPRLVDRRFPNSRRIRKRPEFLRIERVGQRRARPSFVVLTAMTRATEPRLGITASRKVGNAVVRNRIKRMVREFFRHHQHLLEPRDIVVIARSAAADITAAAAHRDLSFLLGINADA